MNARVETSPSAPTSDVVSMRIALAKMQERGYNLHHHSADQQMFVALKGYEESDATITAKCSRKGPVWFVTMRYQINLLMYLEVAEVEISHPKFHLLENKLAHAASKLEDFR